MDTMDTSVKTWTIVKFKENSSVAAVPTPWITDNRECLWPPFTADKTASAIKSYMINTCWPTFKIEIFRNATYDNYETARLKCRRAEVTSDLNTEDEEPAKRRRVMLRKYSSSSEESEETILKTPPKLKKKTDTAKTLNSVTLEPTSLPSTSTLVPSSRPASPQFRQNSNIREIGENDDKENCKCCPHHRHGEYLKQIIMQQNMLKSILCDVLSEVRAAKNSETVQIINNEESIFKKFELPIKSENEFELFNTYLEEENNFTKAITEMCKIGGKDNYDFVKRCMGTLISNGLAMQYSWLGRREKKGFCNFQTAKLIMHAADKAKMAANMKETENSLKNWLRRARDRSLKIK